MTSDLQDWLNDMDRTVTLDLKVRDGAVRAHNPDREKLDRQAIELECSSIRNRLDDDRIIIGNDVHQNPDQGDDRKRDRRWRMDKLDFNIGVTQIDEDWLTNVADLNDGATHVGVLDFSDPQLLGGSAQMVGWVVVGPDTFQLIRDQLLAATQCDFYLCITLEFPRESAERNTSGRRIKWNGKGGLKIRGATAVWKLQSQSEDHSQDDREPIDLDHRQDIADGTSSFQQAVTRIESSISKVTIAIWLLVGAVVGVTLFK